MRVSRAGRVTLRTLALGYLAVLLAFPIVTILWRTFQPGLGAFWDAIRTPAAISALNLTVLIVAIVVPLNVVFGVVTALVLARGRFPGRRPLSGIVDLPFAVSPIVVGVALIMLWGADGWFGGLEALGVKVIFGLPGMVIATLFVTLPFVVREVEPVLREIGTEQEQAAATLGASAWQTFSRITLPAIRWGLTYGIVLTAARAWRVRRGDHGQLLREPASGDAFFAQLTRAEAADLDLRAGDRVWVLPTRTLSSEVRPTALAS